MKRKRLLFPGCMYKETWCWLFFSPLEPDLHRYFGTRGLATAWPINGLPAIRGYMSEISLMGKSCKS